MTSSAADCCHVELVMLFVSQHY